MADPLLAGRRIVVVGATGGLGGAIVDELLSLGASLLATGRSEESLDSLPSRGAVVHRLELFDPGAPLELARRVDEIFGGVLDGLVLAAATQGAIGPTRTIAPTALERAFREGPVATLAIVQACAAQLDRSRSPSLVFFSGGGGTAPFPRYTPYALAKVALVRLVENLAAEEPGWKVNAVAPGFVATSIHRATLLAGPELAGANFEVTRTRIEQDAASPGLAASLVAFLLGPESDGITGRLVSAVWDAWGDEEFRRLLRKDPSLGRLRRIDGQRFVDLHRR